MVNVIETWTHVPKPAETLAEVIRDACASVISLAVPLQPVPRLDEEGRFVRMETYPTRDWWARLAAVVKHEARARMNRDVHVGQNPDHLAIEWAPPGEPLALVYALHFDVDSASLQLHPMTRAARVECGAER